MAAIAALAAATPPAELARTLPKRLIRFFNKFPPRVTPNTIEPPKLVPVTSKNGEEKAMMQQNNRDILASHPISDPNYNPFLPWKNPETGRWRGAKYGLRIQADLCKMAQQYGVEELLPWSRKKSGVKQARREILGSRVRGTGEGQTVKGHKWEREMFTKMHKRKEAMLGMPELIKEWKIRGHGKGWKKWPR